MAQLIIFLVSRTHRLADMANCNQCNSFVLTSAKFCHRCGHTLDSGHAGDTTERAAVAGTCVQRLSFTVAEKSEGWNGIL